MQISDREIEIFQEMINIGIGRAGATLNQILSTHIELNVPHISVLSLPDYLKQTKKENEIFSAVEMGFDGPFPGAAHLIFSNKSAAQLVSALVGDEVKNDEIDEIKSGTLSEIGNILLNSVMGSISNILQDHFNYSVVEYMEGTLKNLIERSFRETTLLIIAETNFYIQEMEIDGQIAILMTLKSFEIMEKAIGKII
ncbi:MAG: chemotaxis protein CheC [Candidatus Marinimicrobia bacterium]|nr:chemotaxis protein CheC [Candidatus Neomarinimicrobiota bacterium]